MSARWRWAGACSIGTSHVEAGGVCQDRAACRTMETPSGPVLVAVVSDGAGSARKAEAGATIVCTDLHRRIAGYFRGGGTLANINAECAAEWLDSVRDRIGVAASAASLRPRDYAATLVCLIAGDERAVVVHVGDGAAVVRDGATGAWSVPSWPFHGEYVSTTRFVVDDPEPRFEIVHVEASIDRFALFTDGIENLVLDQRKKSASAPFFERLLQPVAAWEGEGRSRKLSRHLRAYLDGAQVCEGTDDDKSLILAARG